METPNIPSNLKGVSTSAHTSSLYFLQMNDSNLGSTETIPLHLFLNQLDNKLDQYFVPILPTKLNNVDHTQNSPKLLHQQIDLCDESISLTNGNSTYSQSLTNPLLLSSPIILEKKPLEKVNITSEKIKPVKNYVCIPDRPVVPRAIAGLPTVLRIHCGCISPRRPLDTHVRFGPLLGVNHRITQTRADELALEAALSKVPIFLFRKEEGFVEHVDVSDKDKSSWLSLLPLGDASTANVWLYEEDNQLFGITVKAIASRTPLALGYSKQYAEKHLLPPGAPVLDLDKEDPEQWWCYECNRAMGNANLLQRHLKIYHKAEKEPARRRYRCKHCSHTFSRLFTLKRHSSKFCTKRKEKSNQTIISKPQSNLNLSSYTPLNIEENRLPSDESLQNYTNGLDFSTNLFDTDRIASLDASGSSRSEAEFNPYDNVATSGTGYIQFSNEVDDIQFIKEKKIKDKSDKETLIACNYCALQIVKSKKRLHVRECPKRRFECECGQVFNKKEALATHIHAEHPDVLTKASTDETKTQSNTSLYQCEKCSSSFKRRGMLANHLWRVHETRLGTGPVERRARLHPCALCPKVYCAAAKRDRHARNHHPGAEGVRVAPILGSRLAWRPAPCPAPLCPRQYATRAKLLQHMRRHHPHLAEPVKTKSSPSVKPSETIFQF